MRNSLTFVLESIDISRYRQNLSSRKENDEGSSTNNGYDEYPFE
jgi:hypothetical protein